RRPPTRRPPDARATGDRIGPLRRPPGDGGGPAGCGTAMQTLDLIGIFAFAVSGALMAIRRDFDVVGIAVLGVVTRLGRGIIRDVALGDTPPPAFTRWEYLVTALAAAAVTAVAHPGVA